MTDQLKSMQGVSEAFSGNLTMDEFAFIAIIGTLFIGYILYGLWYQLKQMDRSTFESMH